MDVYIKKVFFFIKKKNVKQSHTLFFFISTHKHLITLSHQVQIHYLTQSITTKGPNSCSSRVGLNI